MAKIIKLVETTYLVTVIDFDDNAGEFYPRDYKFTLTESVNQTILTMDALLKIRDARETVSEIENLTEEQKVFFERLDSELESFLFENWADIKTITIIDEWEE